MTADLIAVAEVGEGIVVLTLDRPERKNALSIALRDAVSDALDSFAERDDLRVVVLTGSGTAFCGGFDLGEFGDPSPAHHERLWASSDRFHHRVLRFPLPTIAAVNGPAHGGGFDLACMADLRVATPAAVFAHPEHRWAPVLYRLLHDLVGGSIARELVLTGRTVTADEAARIGLVTTIVDADALIDTALGIARTIAEAPRDVLVTTKAKIVECSRIDTDLKTLEW